MHLNADFVIVLVRRVVEARRLAAGDSPAHRTAALPQPNHKDPSTHHANEKGDKEPKESLWKRLRCW